MIHLFCFFSASCSVVSWPWTLTWTVRYHGRPGGKKRFPRKRDGATITDTVPDRWPWNRTTGVATRTGRRGKDAAAPQERRPGSTKVRSCSPESTWCNLCDLVTISTNKVAGRKYFTSWQTAWSAELGDGPGIVLSPVQDSPPDMFKLSNLFKLDLIVHGPLLCSRTVGTRAIMSAMNWTLFLYSVTERSPSLWTIFRFLLCFSSQRVWRHGGERAWEVHAAAARWRLWLGDRGSQFPGERAGGRTVWHVRRLPAVLPRVLPRSERREDRPGRVTDALSLHDGRYVSSGTHLRALLSDGSRISQTGRQPRRMRELIVNLLFGQISPKTS